MIQMFAFAWLTSLIPGTSLACDPRRVTEGGSISLCVADHAESSCLSRNSSGQDNSGPRSSLSVLQSPLYLPTTRPANERRGSYVAEHSAPGEVRGQTPHSVGMHPLRGCSRQDNRYNGEFGLSRAIMMSSNSLFLAHPTSVHQSRNLPIMRYPSHRPPVVLISIMQAGSAPPISGYVPSI